MRPPTRGMMAGMTDEADEAAMEGAASATAPSAEDQDEDGEDVNVTPEEQKAYDEFVTTGFELIYEGGVVLPGIVKLLDDDPADLIAVLGNNVPELRERFSPLVALAATTVIVVMEVEKRLGEKPDGAILMHGGKELLENLAEIAEVIGKTEFSEDDLGEAFLHAVDLYQAVASAEGRLDRDLASQEFADILNAEEQGRLDSVLPELAKEAP